MFFRISVNNASCIDNINNNGYGLLIIIKKKSMKINNDLSQAICSVKDIQNIP